MSNKSIIFHFLQNSLPHTRHMVIRIEINPSCGFLYYARSMSLTLSIAKWARIVRVDIGSKVKWYSDIAWWKLIDSRTAIVGVVQKITHQCIHHSRVLEKRTILKNEDITLRLIGFLNCYFIQLTISEQKYRIIWWHIVKL